MNSDCLGRVVVFDSATDTTDQPPNLAFATLRFDLCFLFWFFKTTQATPMLFSACSKHTQNKTQLAGVAVDADVDAVCLQAPIPNSASIGPANDDRTTRFASAAEGCEVLCSTVQVCSPGFSGSARSLTTLMPFASQSAITESKPDIASDQRLSVSVRDRRGRQCLHVP